MDWPGMHVAVLGMNFKALPAEECARFSHDKIEL